MSYYIGYFEIAAFLASLVAWPQLQKSSYLRWFPLLLFIILAVDIPQLFLKAYLPKNNSLIYNIHAPLQQVIYSFIIYESLVKRSWKRVILIGGGFFIVFTAITLVYFTEPGHFNVLSYSAGLLLIVTGILLKFYEMLQNPADFNFMREPFFYILFAFLLFNVGTLPYFVMVNWLHWQQTHPDEAMVFRNVMSVFNYVLYTTYTVSFLWMRLKKELS
jgi:hypothetical protein